MSPAGRMHHDPDVGRTTQKLGEAGGRHDLARSFSEHEHLDDITRKAAFLPILVVDHGPEGRKLPGIDQLDVLGRTRVVIGVAVHARAEHRQSGGGAQSAPEPWVEKLRLPLLT